MNKKKSKRAAAAVTAAMLLQVFSMSGAVSASSDVAINADNFPDDTFRQYVSDNFDTNGDGSLSQAETDAVNVIAVEETSSTQGTVADLTGISYFKKLQMLRCGNNRLTSLDVSSNPDLVYLDCINNQLTSLDVSRNTALTYLFCSGNTYSIDTASGSFSLGDLPAGFDPARASDWTGAEYDPTTNSLKNITSAVVTCAYDCGNEYYMTVTLAASHINTDSFVTISEETFPDAVFRQYVSDNFDHNKDGKLSQSERDSAYRIDVIGTLMDAKDTVADLTGIEYFTYLKILDCYCARLTSLDLSKNTALKEVYCFGNQLTSLNLGNNTCLRVLRCDDNQLTTLDLRKNTELRQLDCHENQIESLYFGRNAVLEDLTCYSNPLKTLDISRYTSLKYLDCYDDQLTSLDVSKNTALLRLYCDGNQLTSIDVSDLELEDFNCSENTFSIVTTNGSFSLTELPAGFDPAKASEWTGATYYSETNSLNNFTGDTVTYTYECGNGFTETFTLVLNGNNDDTAVTIGADTFPDAAFRQYVSDNFDTDKDGRLSREEMDAVVKIDVAGTSRTPGAVADLTGIGYFTKLEGLYCGYNQLTSLDVSKNTALEDLNCCSNQLTSLDVSKNTALTRLDCDDNQLTSLDVSKNTALEDLNCCSNQLTSLDVSKNTALTRLDCGNNQLTSLDVSKNTALTELYCDDNQLTSLDVSKNTDLTSLDCHKNQLTDLNVSNNTTLESLDCGYNLLTSLDVRNNTALTSLSCYTSRLTSLNLSKNTALTSLYCHDSTIICRNNTQTNPYNTNIPLQNNKSFG